MRDKGFEFYWSDPYCKNIHAVGFDCDPSKQYSAVTAFEVMEHLIDPLKFLEDTFKAKKSNTLFFTTELFTGEPPKPEDWWYYAFETGQHISFYRKDTLELIAKKLGVTFFSKDGLHIFCDQETSIRIQRYFDSRIVRALNKRRMRGFLRSKTFQDHLDLLNSGNL